MEPECQKLHLLAGFPTTAAGKHSWRKQEEGPQPPAELRSEAQRRLGLESRRPALGVSLCCTFLHTGVAEAPALNFTVKQITVGLISSLPFIFCFIANCIQQQYTPSLYILRNTNPRLLLAKIFLF